MASSWNIEWYRKSGIEDFDSKQGCPDFFEYLTILSRICGPPIPHELDYYRNDSIKWSQDTVKRFRIQNLMIDS